MRSALAIAGGLVVAAGVAAAQAPDPAALEDAAYQDFAAGRLEEALRGYERVYRLAPRPELLFAIGNLQQKLGRCTQAIETLEDYLASRPGAGAARAQALIDDCRAGPTDRGPSLLPPPPDPAPAPATRDTGDAGRGRRRAALVVGGLGLVAGGGAVAAELIGRSHLRESDALRPTDLAAAEAEYDTANRYHYAAQGAALASGACLVTAVVLWITAPSRAPAVAAAPVRGGALVTWDGTF